MQKAVSPHHTPEGWADAAEAYETWIMPRTTLYAEDALRLANVKAGERVLDVAAGTGALALAAARLGAEVVATDSSPGMLERLRARVSREGPAGVATHVMDGQALELPDASFDAAFCIFGIMFFPDRSKGFREILRVLRPGGRAAVVTWSAPERVRVMTLGAQATRIALPDLPPAEPSPAFTLQERPVLEREMREAGFRGVRSESVSHFWDAESPELFWEGWRLSSPTCRGLLKEVGPAKEAAVHDALIGILREEFGDGPVELESEAHIGVGVK